MKQAIAEIQRLFSAGDHYVKDIENIITTHVKTIAAEFVPAVVVPPLTADEIAAFRDFVRAHAATPTGGVNVTVSAPPAPAVAQLDNTAALPLS